MSSIIPAVPSQVPQWLFYLGTDAATMPLSAACSTLEGAFYASLRAGSAQANRFVRWVGETSHARVHEIQAIFNGANALLVAFYGYKLVKEIQGTFQFSVIELAAAWSFGTLPVMLTVGSAFVIGVLILDRLHQKTLQPGMTSNQKVAKALHVTKLVLNVALACFVKNRFWFVVGLAGSVYSLWSDCKRPVTEKDPAFPPANFFERWNVNTFETLHAQYSVVRAGLSYLQQYPELAMTIEKISVLTGAIDLFWLGGTCYYLCQKIAEKFPQKLKAENVPVISIGSPTVLLGLSFLGIHHLKDYLYSNALLKELVAQISPTLAQNSSIGWVSFEGTQATSLARLIASTALSLFSKQRLISLVNLSAQALNLHWISRLSWLEWTQAISSPLDKITGAGGTVSSTLTQWKWTNLDIRSTFILHPSCASDPQHLKSSLQALSGYINQLFEQSKWELFENKLVGALKKIPFPTCGCTLPTALADISMTASIQKFWHRFGNFEYWWTSYVPVEIR